MHMCLHIYFLQSPGSQPGAAHGSRTETFYYLSGFLIEANMHRIIMPGIFHIKIKDYIRYFDIYV